MASDIQVHTAVKMECFCVFRPGRQANLAPSPMATPSHLALPLSPSTFTLGGRRVRNVILHCWEVRGGEVGEEEGEQGSHSIFFGGEN